MRRKYEPLTPPIKHYVIQVIPLRQLATMLKASPPARAEGSPVMSPFLSLFVPVFGFLMLLTIGFSLRERDVGVLMMWIGTLGIFGLTCWKILEKLPT